MTAPRPERPDEAEAIAALITTAFLSAPHADGTEAAIVAGLRAAGALALSLVIADAAGLAGHVAFSPVTVGGRAGGWFGLGPLAVRQDRRRAGLGAALVAEGLARLTAQGAAGCVVLGDPGYYGRFGFAARPGWTLPGVPPACFMVRPLTGAPGSGGIVAYHPAFAAP